MDAEKLLARFEKLRVEMRPLSDAISKIVGTTSKRKVLPMPPDPVSPREMAEEIKPCPWCGGPCFILREKVDPRESPYVFCDSEQCGASGPCDLDPEKGVRSWNRVASREERISELELMLRAMSGGALRRVPDGYGPWRWREMRLRDDGTGLPLIDADARRAMERG